MTKWVDRGGENDNNVLLLTFQRIRTGREEVATARLGRLLPAGPQRPTKNPR